MPYAAPRPCNHPGCGAVSHERFCKLHLREVRRAVDQARGSAAKRGYGRKWQKASKAFLIKHPLCVACQAEDRTTAATVVDHIRPHRGDMTLFWDRSNWQSLCKPCHDAKTAREDGGFGRG